ncbi:MAG: hypothetical protein WD969_10415 [Paracoccaceae bacterium]
MIEAAIIIGAYIVLLSIAGVFQGAVRRWFGRGPNLSKLLQAFPAALVFWLVMTSGLMVALSATGVDIFTVFALISGASFIHRVRVSGHARGASVGDEGLDADDPRERTPR